VFGQNSEDKNGTYSREVSRHGPGICKCEVAEKCPYWEQELQEYNLSMNRGLSIGGKDNNLLYVGDTNDLEKLRKKD
jgi:hypothetical protein